MPSRTNTIIKPALERLLLQLLRLLPAKLSAATAKTVNIAYEKGTDTTSDSSNAA